MAAGLFYVYTDSALRRERRVFGLRNAIGA